MQGRTISIIPKRPGTLLLTVQDADLPLSMPTTATLHISPIASLHLHSAVQLIEQGDEMNLTVTARDAKGMDFDEDQYERMEIGMQTEMTGVHDKDDMFVEKIQGVHRVFRIRGKEPGIYRLTAYAEGGEGGRRVASQADKIEVFPRLELHPTDLLLTPNMRYTLSVQGGPSSGSPGKTKDGSLVDARLDIADRQIATIDAHQEITAHTTGDTELIYKIIHTVESQQSGSAEDKSLHIVSKRSIKIRVRLVTSIEIPHNRQRIIYTGSLLKQIAVLKYKNETFSHGIAPVSFAWNCSHHAILKAYLPEDHFGSGASASTSPATFSPDSGSKFLNK